MMEPSELRIFKDGLNKMDLCRHLLPPPGDEVVGELIAKIRSLLKSESEAYLAGLKKASELCETLLDEEPHNEWEHGENSGMGHYRSVILAEIDKIEKNEKI
jgi:hypothetical protein